MTTTYFRFMRNYPELKAYKTSALDPLRSAQACREVAERFEAMVEKALGVQAAAGLHPYLLLSSIPIELVYNMDEVAANGNLKRLRKMGSLKQQVKRNWFTSLARQFGACNHCITAISLAVNAIVFSI